jgi:hypothetical protein
MAINFKISLLEQVPTSSTSVYSTPSVTSAHIVYATVHNEGSSASTLTLNVVRSGGSVAVTNQYIKQTIQPNQTVPLVGIVGRVLNTNDAIFALSSIASSLNLAINIKEITS